ncbi:DUF6383 domain-containing protein [Parabacteroides sp. AF18-52]|jgi:hypothetical protein|uniref:DUF6383 domain-containing protein n=1 Tax=Parabacteroides TaxID=375288 RepID=UPI0011C36DFC|nr:DUF6383 domain-containing protein [Parabacteroides sp. AF18-52]
MNKKFSTLVVGAMLCSAVGASAQIQNSVSANVPDNFGYEWKTLSHFVMADTLHKAPAYPFDVTEIKDYTAGNILYQLSNAAGDSVLVQLRDKETGALYLKMDSISKAPLNYSLWRVKVDAADGVSGAKFTFTNAETGVDLIFDDQTDNSNVLASATANLSVADKDSTILNGCQNKWQWYNSATNNGAAISTPTAVFAYFGANNDHVMVMQLNDKGQVVAVKYPRTVVGATGVSAITDALKLRPRLASPLVLDPLALNTLVDFNADGTFKLKSSANPTIASEFISGEFKAVSADAFLKAPVAFATGVSAISDQFAQDTLGLNSADSLNLYVALQSKTDATKYMMVDSVPESGFNDYVPLKFRTYDKATSLLSDTILATRFLYKFTYYASEDSLVIEPLNALPMASIGDKYVWRNKGIAYNSYYNNRREFLAADNKPISDLRDAAQDSVVVTLVKLGNETALTAYNNGGTSVTTPKFNFDGRDLSTKWLQRATLTEGLNYIMTGGKYVVANLVGWTQYDVPTEAQKFVYMPATMWDVQQIGCEADATSPVQIANREFANEVFKGQLYKDATGKVFIIDNNYNTAIDNISVKSLYNKDGYDITTVVDKDGAAAAAIIASDYHGYRHLSSNELAYNEFKLKYNVTDNLTGGKDALVAVDKDMNFVATTDGSSTYFQVEQIEGAPTNFGTNYSTTSQLKKYAYKLKVRDANLIDNDKCYVYLAEITQSDGTKRSYYKAYTPEQAAANNATLAKFYLKNDQVDTEREYYTLVDTVGSTLSSGVLENAHRVALGDGVQHMTSVNLRNYVTDDIDAFALIDASRNLYQNVDDLSGKTVKVYRERQGNSTECLYENSTSGFNFLGIGTGTDFKPGENYTTALYLHAIGGEHMPQYMLGVATGTVEDGKWCDKHGYNPTCSGEHFEPVDYKGYLYGRFLVNLNDSTDNAYMWNDVYTRLAFMEGVIKDGVFYQVNAGNGYTLASLSEKYGVIAPADFNDNTKLVPTTLTKDVHANCLFSLRKITDDGEDFLLETNLDGVSGIGSFKGAWVKIENGVPVLAKSKEEVGGSHDGDEAKVDELVKQAQVFSLKDAEGEIATDNESISSTSEVSVIAAKGSVRVLNAIGKSVKITNLLGQTVAETIATSNDVEVNAPTGIVVVAVEGETAVKAIVK